jgi:hypothetical protein
MSLFSNLGRALRGTPAPASNQAQLAASTTAEGSATVLAETTPVKRAVIVGHSSSRAAAIFSGVVGTIDNDRFKLDPAYTRISYLFTLAGEGALDAGTRFKEVELPNQAAADQLLLNMVAASGATWDKLYDMVGEQMASQGDLVRRMLEQEKATVHTCVDAFVASHALPTYLVPVKYEAWVAQTDGSAREARTEPELLKLASPATLSLALDTGRTTQLASEVSQAGDAGAALSDATAQHTGAIELSVKGSVPVRASSEANAVAILLAIQSISDNTITRNVLTIAPQAIENATLIPFDGYAHDDAPDSGGYYERPTD